MSSEGQKHLVVEFDPETVKAYLNNRCRGLPNALMLLKPPARVKGASKRRVVTKGPTKRRVDRFLVAKALGADLGVNNKLTESLGNYQLILISGTEFRVEDDYVIFEHPETGNSIFFKTRWILRILEFKREFKTDKIVWEREEREGRDGTSCRRT